MSDITMRRARKRQVDTANIITEKRIRRKPVRTTQTAQEKEVETTIDKIGAKKKAKVTARREKQQIKRDTILAYENLDDLSNLFSNLTTKATDMHELDRLFAGMGGGGRKKTSSSGKKDSLNIDLTRVVKEFNKRVEHKTRLEHKKNVNKLAAERRKQTAERKKRDVARKRNEKREETREKKRIEKINREKKASFEKFIAKLNRDNTLRNERVRRTRTIRKRANTTGWSEGGKEMLRTLQNIRRSRTPSPMDSSFGMIVSAFTKYTKNVQKLQTKLTKLSKK